MADAVMVTKVIEVDVKASAQASAHMKAIADGMKGVEENTNKASGSLKEMQSWVKGFIGFQIFDMVGSTVLKMASAIQEASDKSKLLEERMKLVTRNSEEAGIAFQNIVDVSIRQGRELDATAKLYERVQRSSTELGISQKGVALITEGMAASLRLAGAGTQEANAAMLQFSQALASGKLGGDEFRSLMENDSVLMKAFADQLHTTMGGLREMSKEGKLSSEVLRNAMLVLGEDGKNMLQRLIEQAAKLPKTFDQAVTGSKAAFIDLVNALQQTADKSEGFFTRMVDRLGRGMREAAQLTRDRAEVQAAIARGRGEKVDVEQPEMPEQAKRTERIFAQQADARRRLIQAQNRLDDFTRNNFSDKMLENRTDYKQLANNVRDARSEISAYTDQLARLARQDELDALKDPYKTGPVKTSGGKEKKITGRTDEDILKSIKMELANKADEIQGKLGEELPWEAVANAYVRRLDAAKDKLTKAQLDAAISYIRTAVEKNYYDEKEADFQRFLTVQKQKFDERQIGIDEREARESLEKHDAAVKKAIDAYNREHLTKDPFEGAEELISPLRSLMNDSRTTQEEADKLALAIHAIHEKATRQLLGEKEPLQDVAHQMGDVWESEFNRMEDSLLDFSKSAKDIIGDMVVNILSSFAKIQLNRELQPLMNAGQDWLMKTIGEWFPSAASPSAHGNVFNGGIRMFANGGVLNGPTPFSFNGGRSLGVGGEAGDEALVPLKRGADGNLGVGQAPVKVEVYNMGSNTKARTEESTGSNGERRIKVIVEDVVDAALGSGRHDDVLGKSFGITRKGS